MGVIIGTIFICIWIAGVCWILGAIQKRILQSNSKYQRLKAEMRKSMLKKE